MRNKNKIKKYYLTPTYPGIYLSKREAQCAAYFLKGYSNRALGEVLGLSPKTIDSYTASMRKKLGCRSKTELIAKICQTDFVNEVNNLINNLNINLALQ